MADHDLADPCPVRFIGEQQFPHSEARIYLYLDPLTQTSFSVNPTRGQTLAGQLSRARQKYHLDLEGKACD